MRGLWTIKTCIQKSSHVQSQRSVQLDLPLDASFQIFCCCCSCFCFSASPASITLSSLSSTFLAKSIEHLLSQNEMQSPHLVSWKVSLWNHKWDWLMNLLEHSLHWIECITSSCSLIRSRTDRNPTCLNPSRHSRQFLTLSIALDTGNFGFICPNCSNSELLLNAI